MFNGARHGNKNRGPRRTDAAGIESNADQVAGVRKPEASSPRFHREADCPHLFALHELGGELVVEITHAECKQRGAGRER